MRKVLLSGVLLALLGVRTAEAQNLLLNGNLDAPGPGATINGWTKDESKTVSGPTSDLVTLEPWSLALPVAGVS